MNILIATDGTSQGDSAIDMLRPFGLGPDDQIKIVSVVDMAVPLAIDVYGGYLPDTTELEKTARENAARVLGAAEGKTRAIVGDRSANITAELLYGSPESRIVEAAEQMPADLIIVGSHGYNRWERLLLGSVSDSVVHHAPCSVLIVRTSPSKTG
jgi:nucleotide-binding universal stress UspA family protein